MRRARADLKQAQGLEAGVAVAADDEMVVNADLEFPGSKPFISEPKTTIADTNS